MKETADKNVPKAKRKKVTKWLFDEAVKIADERRDVRSKGDDNEYRRLNAAFQRRARQDKEQSLKEKCRLVEESNKMGRTRDLFREIKEMTGSYSARCGAMKLSTGKVVTEEKEVKEIWQHYTEELYRRDPNATDAFNENIYEDEPEVMETEVKEALRHISNRKSAGCDGIPIELLKAGGEEAVKVMTGLCNCIWKRKVYVPIYKKGDKQESGNYRTIALISHASKVLLRIIQRRLEVFLIPELPIEQAGFRRGRGTRDHIANLRWIMDKAREHQRDLYMCFIDYKKAFDCVDHERLWVILMDMGVPVHLIVLLRRPGSDSQNGVWRDRQHQHWERSATGMYPLTTAIQHIRRKHIERGFGRMGEGNQHRREDGDEPEICRRHNTARWDQGSLGRTCGKSQASK